MLSKARLYSCRSDYLSDGDLLMEISVPVDCAVQMLVGSQASTL